MKNQNKSTVMRLVKIRLKEFEIPPVSDALVLGKRAPIGSEAMTRALTLLHVAEFERFELDVVCHEPFCRSVHCLAAQNE